jgi:predicted transposase/invertase (TIGR01784 family)
MSLLEEWNLKDAVAVAKRDGREEGKKQQAIEIARNFKAKGISVDDIADATGLTVDDVLRL